MSNAADDRTLLQRYANEGCEEAFATLVARHIDHVYSVARRESVSAEQAQELTQVAFIILARKAKRLPRGTILSGWLFQTVRYAAQNARRSEERRQRREQETAYMSATENHASNQALWEQIEPLLNEALAAIGAADRDAITLRFFEKKSHAEIAAALRTNEASVRKRLSRAIERLRISLARRGAFVPAAMLLSCLTAHSVDAAPTILATEAANMVMSGATASTSTLASSTLKLMALSKLKSLAATAVILLLAGGAAIIVSPSVFGERSLSRTLSDGSVLRISQMEIAPRVSYKYQSSVSTWQRALHKILPEDVARKFAGNRSSAAMTLSTIDGSQTLFVGTVHEGRKDDTKIHINRLEVAGEDGSVFDGAFYAGNMSFPHESFTGWRVNAFPRRGSYITLRFFYPESSGRSTLAAEMRIRNPAATGAFPAWIPEPLPIARTNGDLVAKLVDFEAGGPQSRVNNQTSSFWKELPGTECAFTLAQPGRTMPPWTVRSLQISDATGNRWTQPDLAVWADSNPATLLHASMLGVLWASEPAWNLRVEFSRTNEFTPEELITLPGVPVPKPATSIELDDSRPVNEVSVDLGVIGGEGAELRSPYKWMSHPGKVNLALSVLGDMSRKRLSLLAVRDDRGRPVPFEDPYSAVHNSDVVLGLAPKPEARSLTLTFAVHTSRYMDFRAKPRQVKFTSQ